MARMTSNQDRQSKDVRIAARYIPNNSRCILEHTNGSAAHAYECAGKFYAIMFWGTSAKPCQHYSYRTEDARNRAIWSFRESVEQSVTLRSKARADRKATPHTFRAGDIVNTSWGYDQTNVDFYIVTRVTSACVWVRPIASDYEATGFMSGKCWPAMPIRTTGEESRHVARGGYFSINGHSASLTTGEQHSSSYA